ncbi:unnamed protein product [Lactuca virosa]|uniref:Uncharacterized protein n=1 Tax=Lactuca virosa TaxID=75947 RepID=A0AAU9M186_9ASTR|nr:unnamed protein product [Lactuca virosa]
MELVSWVPPIRDFLAAIEDGDHWSQPLYVGSCCCGPPLLLRVAITTLLPEKQAGEEPCRWSKSTAADPSSPLLLLDLVSPKFIVVPPFPCFPSLLFRHNRRTITIFLIIDVLCVLRRTLRSSHSSCIFRRAPPAPTIDRL